MSSASAPISAERFAEAIEDLSIGLLHNKAAEIQNSISHLEVSNEQLQQYADAGDKDCSDAISENRTVIVRMEERITLLKEEVVRRGLPWPNNGGVSSKDTASSGRETGNGVQTNGAPSGTVPTSNPSRYRIQYGEVGSTTESQSQGNDLPEDDGLHL